MHVHVTAGFCDLGFRGTITLEIHVIHPIRVYPNIPICQAYFLKPQGVIELYNGRYSGQVDPTPSRFALKKSEYQEGELKPAADK
jgi:dCTP deaminase